ncbi:TIGR03667 family PPOX class F420-dependent oxidoreductase [Mycolicibacterium sp. CR10]|uniref:TIGR03667 family PPOX class F420-dependent oxidoreductase n=1 Tax=Mycolicibacterium sp. CR10 TaxID=2562314 RepID=UPI0010C10E66|nr:TIGR03667 family PPOX class F420-dependent oxidoreductase [Mycolicibacterium sp. CR10]
MAVEFTEEVSRRLETDQFGWLTTVARSGQPVPRLVWFYFDGADVIVYTQPTAAKVRHIRNHPQVSLNLDSDGQGAGIIVLGGTAAVDSEDSDPREDSPYWRKYAEQAEQIGLTDAMGAYSLRMRISVDKVWTTPTEPE